MKTKFGVVGLVCVIALTASADDPSKSELTGVDVVTIAYERQLQAEIAEQRALEMQQASARDAAHAEMPSTMYASTPSDPNKVPHAMPGSGSQTDPIVDLVIPRYLESVTEAESRPISERWKRVLRTIKTVEQSLGRRDLSRARLLSEHPTSVHFGIPERGVSNYDDRLVIPYFPSASDPSNRQGFVRLVNLSSRAGDVTIEAIDDGGMKSPPLVVSIDASSVLHLTSTDLEQGNLQKGLEAGTGPGQGAWVLALSSTVAIEAHPYIQMPDGYLTTINDTLPIVGDAPIVTFYVPSVDSNPQDLLRLVNLNAETVTVLISRVDQMSKASKPVKVELPAHHARTYATDDLAIGAASELSGILHEVEGFSRLKIETVPGVLAMSFSVNSAGHMTNLSSLAERSGMRFVPLFMSASDPHGRRGLIQVVNRESRSGSLSIQAFDDSGRAYETLSITMSENSSIEIDSNDLELGNPSIGLSGRTGSGVGNWRLELSSELDLDVRAFVRTPDGLSIPMQETVSPFNNRHDVSWFKAADDADQVGLLRLINGGRSSANVTIHGTDDSGVLRGKVHLTIEATASRTLTSAELELGGEDLTGLLGNGFGEWRLAVIADAPIDVMNLLVTPTGHLVNLSDASSVTSTDEAETAESLFESTISPIIHDDCINCHVVRGFAQNSRLVFVTVGDPKHLTKNLNAFKELLDEVDDGAALVLDRIQGIGHPPGVRIAAGTDEFAAMQRFLALLGQPVVAPPAVTAETLFDNVTLESNQQTLRRAAIVFAGRIPTHEEYAALVEGDEMSLRTSIRGLMQGPGFHDFLIRASNDQLFTDRDFRIVDDDGDGFVEYAKALYNAGQGSRTAYNEYKRLAQYGFRREPLELVAHVVENDLPYTEILTADYVMANPMTAMAYGATTEFTDEDDPHEFRVSEIVDYYRRCDGYDVDRADLGYVVVDPGPCSTEYPHAGLLNTKVFLQRYPTTATNRNRARSRWTYYHFLGIDIEKSASRTTDPVALADTNNPTLGNPACTVCHTVLDPVAGVFQNYGDRGSYRDQRGGLDALDRFYKYNPAGRNDISVERRTQEDSVVSLGTVRLFADRVNELGLKNQRTFDGDTKLHFGLGEVTVRDMNGDVVHQYDVSDVVQEEDCGTAFAEGYRLWDCQKLLPLPLAVSTTGDYEVRVEAWVIEEGSTAGRLQAWMPGPFYRDGDTWYRDMREPGFGEDMPTESHDSVKWLAGTIVEDERFATATVEFWWPAIMGSEVVEPPEDAEDAGSEPTLLASNAQSQEIERLASAFSEGFGDGEPFNLKDLLVEITLSPWFRAAAVEGDDELQRSAVSRAGARRLLTPAELANKTLDLTGFQWGRHRDQSWSQPHEDKLSSLTDPTRGYGLLYGGIDSDGVLERARDLTSTMAGVAQSHASESSCPIVMRELFLLPEEDRLLFKGHDRRITPKWEFGKKFEIDAASYVDREALSQSGHLSTGMHEVAMSFTNNFDDDNGDRNVLLYELRVLNASDEVVHEASLKDLAPYVASTGACGIANAWNEATEERDHFNLHSTCLPVVAEFNIETGGSHTVEVVAWADQYGEDLAELEIVVQSNATSSAGSMSIREQLVRLYERLHGIDVETDSPEVSDTYELFVKVWEANLDSYRASPSFRNWQDVDCDWARDQYFLDGILKDAWVYREDWGDGSGPRHDWDWEHIGSYFSTVDFLDTQGVARTWVVVMTYLLTDYRYLYL